MSKTIELTYNGLGFNGLLFLAFLVLKLTNVITWSWWWVTAPLWIPFGLCFIAFVAIAIYLLLVAYVLK